MKYQTILADPPWPIKWNASAAIGKKHIEYPTMPISEICALPVYDLADANCTLFMWTTNAFLPESLGVLRHWKFQYKMLFTWCKNNGMGGHPRNATEHMVIATRGEPPSDRHAFATLNWLEHPRVGHSVKPKVFRDVVEHLSPAPRIELFARQRVDGWHAWGNEVYSDIEFAQNPVPQAPAVTGNAPPAIDGTEQPAVTGLSQEMYEALIRDAMRWRTKEKVA